MKIKKATYAKTWGIIFIALAIIIRRFFTPYLSLSNFLGGFLAGLGLCLMVGGFIWKPEKAK